MVFTPRNDIFNDLNVMMNNEKLERVYVTKFLVVQIDAQLNWNTHIEYSCKKLSKCIGILAKVRKVLYKSCLIDLYYTFAYPYSIYCNHAWGNAYQINLEKNYNCSEKTIKTNHWISQSCPHWTLICIKQENFKEINEFTIGIFMFKSQNGDLPEFFYNYYQTHIDVHGQETRNADAIYVPYGSLDIRNNSVRKYGADVWNSIPPYTQRSESVTIFKHRLRCYLIDRKLMV